MCRLILLYALRKKYQGLNGRIRVNISCKEKKDADIDDINDESDDGGVDDDGGGDGGEAAAAFKEML